MLGSVTDWLILIVVIVVLFGGASKIPDLARAMGKAMGEYKKAQIEVEKEIRTMQMEANSPTPAAAPARTATANVVQPKVTQTQQDMSSKIEQLERELAELKRSSQAQG